MNAKQPIVSVSSLPAYRRATMAAALAAVLCASSFAFASDSTWQGGNGNWSDANWLDSDTSTVGAFVAGSRAVINDACTIAVDVDTPAVGGLSSSSIRPSLSRKSK